jgi:hypothetical protein
MHFAYCICRIKLSLRASPICTVLCISLFIGLALSANLNVLFCTMQIHVIISLLITVFTKPELELCPDKVQTVTRFCVIYFNIGLPMSKEPKKFVY